MISSSRHKRGIEGGRLENPIFRGGRGWSVSSYVPGELMAMEVLQDFAYLDHYGISQRLSPG